MATHYYLRVSGVTGDSKAAGYNGWFDIDDFGLNAQSDSALQVSYSPLYVDFTRVSKEIVPLLLAGAKGTHFARVEVVAVVDGTSPYEAYHLTVTNAFVGGYLQGTRLDTTMGFTYDSLKETTTTQTSGKLVHHTVNIASTSGGDVTAADLADFAKVRADGATYYLKVAGITGDITTGTYAGWFKVHDYNLGETLHTSGGGGAGGSGKVEFSPLSVDLAKLSAGASDLLQDQATGASISTVRLVAQTTVGSEHVILLDLKLTGDRVLSNSRDGIGGPTVTFDFSKIAEKITDVASDGSTTSKTFSYDLGATTTAVAAPHAATAEPLVAGNDTPVSHPSSLHHDGDLLFA